jgi:hypothetical protein
LIKMKFLVRVSHVSRINMNSNVDITHKNCAMTDT